LKKQEYARELQAVREGREIAEEWLRKILAFLMLKLLYT
jgi:hypothetical protein